VDKAKLLALSSQANILKGLLAGFHRLEASKKVRSKYHNNKLFKYYENQQRTYKKY
jgi:hypothetical protein